MIKLKRIYDKNTSADGKHYLVERLWPRGVKKASLHLDGWFKDAAPSTELRKWFGHDAEKWEEFRRRYFAELDHAPETWEPILVAANGDPSVWSHDMEHNNAVALKDYLEVRISRKRVQHKSAT
jgi:uncharacterized protein YeaO (DUF488 family)